MSEIVIVIAASITSALVGWPITSLILRIAARTDESADLRPEAGQERPTASEEEPEEGADEAIDGAGLLRGGLWIGLLERALVTGGIVVGHPAILAVVVAVKGLGRFPELTRSRAAGERFIIGSFASLLIASGSGILARALWW